MATNNPYVAYAQQAAQRAGIDPSVFVRQIGAESNWNPNAVSSAGATGIAQIMPNFHPNVNPRDPYASLDYAARLMKSHLDKYGSYELALAAYNAGGGAVEKYGGVPPFAETQQYVARILGQGNRGRGGSGYFSARPNMPPPPQPGPPPPDMGAFGLSDVGVPRGDPGQAISRMLGGAPAWAQTALQWAGIPGLSQPLWSTGSLGNPAAAGGMAMTDDRSTADAYNTGVVAPGGVGSQQGYGFGYEDPRHPDHWRFIYETIVASGDVPPFNDAASFNAWRSQVASDEALDRAYRQAQIDAYARQAEQAAADRDMKQRELANKAWETMMQTRSGPQDWPKYWYNSRGYAVPAGEESIPLEQALPPWARWEQPQQPPAAPPVVAAQPPPGLAGPSWVGGGPV